MYKIKQIDYDKMLALLQLGIAAECWIEFMDVPRSDILEALLSMANNADDLEQSVDFYRDSRSDWVRDMYNNGRAECYTLVDSDEED